MRRDDAFYELLVRSRILEQGNGKRRGDLFDLPLLAAFGGFSMDSTGSAEAVQVLVRVRPLLSHEVHAGHRRAVKVLDGSTVQVKRSSATATAVFYVIRAARDGQAS